MFQELSDTEELQENSLYHDQEKEPTENVFPPLDQEEQTEDALPLQDEDQMFQEELSMFGNVTADQLMKTILPDQPVEKQLTDQPMELEDTTLQTADKEQIDTQSQATSKRRKVKPFHFCNHNLNSVSNSFSTHKDMHIWCCYRNVGLC